MFINQSIIELYGFWRNLLELKGRVGLKECGFEGMCWRVLRNGLFRRNVLEGVVGSPKRIPHLTIGGDVPPTIV